MTVILLLAIKHLGKTHTGESHHSNLDDYGFRKLSHMINIPFLFLPKIGKELKGKVYIKEVKPLTFNITSLVMSIIVEAAVHVKSNYLHHSHTSPIITERY